MAIGSALSMYENKLKPHFADGEAADERRSRRMSVTHAQTTADSDSASPGTERVLLQRQILPVDRDTDVSGCTSTPSPAVLDEDKYASATTRPRRSSTRSRCGRTSAAQPSPPRLHRVAHGVPHPGGPEDLVRHLLQRVPRLLLASLDRRRRRRLTVRVTGAGATVTVYRSLANGRAQRVDQRVERVVRGRVLLRPAADAVRRRRLVLVRRRRGRRGRRRGVGRVDRRGAPRAGRRTAR